MTQIVDLLTRYGYFLGVPLALLAVVLWIYRPSAKKGYEADGKIPFQEDKKAGKPRRGEP